MKLLFFSVLAYLIFTLCFAEKTPILIRSKSPQSVFLPAPDPLFSEPEFSNHASLDSRPACPCAKEVQECPACNPFDFTRAQQQINCPCAQKKTCPPCILAKTQKFVHEEAEKEAKAQAETEESLSREAQLQAKLFQLAMKFAKEASEQEALARKAALALQQASSKAQIARNKMKRATNQARLLAIKSISTINLTQLDKRLTNNPPKMDLSVPGSYQEAVTNSELEASADLASDLSSSMEGNENSQNSNKQKSS